MNAKLKAIQESIIEEELKDPIVLPDMDITECQERTMTWVNTGYPSNDIHSSTPKGTSTLNDGRISNGEEHAPVKGNTPGEGHTPARVYTPGEEHAPVKGYTPGEGHAPVKGYTPGEGHTPTKRYTPGEEHTPAKGHIPGERYTPVRGHTPRKGHLPANMNIPGEGHPPVGGHIPAEEYTSGGGNNSVTAPTAKVIHKSAPPTIQPKESGKVIGEPSSPQYEFNYSHHTRPLKKCFQAFP